MLLKSYEEQNLLTNVSVNGATSQAGTYAFRGDLVLTEGDIADSSGRRHPPKAVIKQAILLIKDDKLVAVSGALVDLELLPAFIERYRGDLLDTARVLFYVENLTKGLQTELSGIGITLLPHQDGGAVWNTLMDDLRLDKDDFKGQNAEDKVITLSQALVEFKPHKLESFDYAEAQGFTSTQRREARGPI